MHRHFGLCQPALTGLNDMEGRRRRPLGGLRYNFYRSRESSHTVPRLIFSHSQPLYIDTSEPCRWSELEVNDMRTTTRAHSALRVLVRLEMGDVPSSRQIHPGAPVRQRLQIPSMSSKATRSMIRRSKHQAVSGLR
jgi:hypothetical protein